MQRESHSVIGDHRCRRRRRGARPTISGSAGIDVSVYDPPKGFDSTAAIDEADIVFVCVPTPYTPGRGFDDSYLHRGVGRIRGEKTVVIKSTVLPGTTALHAGALPAAPVPVQPGVPPRSDGIRGLRPARPPDRRRDAAKRGRRATA